MDLSEITEVFVQECDELLEEMERTLLRLEQDINDPEAIHILFRAVHTIKGSAGMFGFDRVATFTHETESLLDTIRTGGMPFTSDLVRLLIESRDHLVRLVRVAADGQTVEDDARLSQSDADLLGQLRTLNAAAVATPADVSTGVATADTSVAASLADDSSVARETALWTIRLKFGSAVFQRGLDPGSFIRYLNGLGAIQSVRILSDDVPAFEELDPESCRLAFAIQLKSAADEAELRSVFEFVEGDCEIDIRRQTVEAAPETPGARQAAPQQNSSRTVRVESERLDHLVTLVGELVISMARMNQLADDSAQTDIVEASYGMLKLVSEIRDGAFGLRMFSIGTLFNRFQRSVRDVAAELKKEVRLEIDGAETRLDKTIIEKISDPLMHLVRNSIDHGIESSSERVRSGKDPAGRILLNAYNEAGEIVIEITDDGAGLNREKILRKAQERGLVRDGVSLSDPEIFQLIFQPGMSTAEQVTSISGRGVGMDVVQRNIEALRGRIELESTAGKGTTVRIRLPLTLAIIDGFLVRVADSHFIFPLDLVQECIEFNQSVYSERTKTMTTDAGPLPVIGLKRFFQLASANSEDQFMRRSRQSLVVVQQAGRRVGLLVDELLGEYQSVIKPLSSIFDGLRALSGATILGNGSIAIVIDVPALLKWCNDEADAVAPPLDFGAVQAGLENEGGAG
ncbi:MAG: chemotaxis protein CheA [bacterium]|nr:chemotaxis protein CheA [bacterium]